MDSEWLNRMDRQVAAFGMESMSKWVKTRVLVVGLKGVGVESAKNLILSGPAAVTFVDGKPNLA